MTALKQRKRIHLKHTDRYDDWHFDGPTNGVRSRLATERFLQRVGPELVAVSEPLADTSHLTRAVSLGVHEQFYVRSVLNGYAGEWLDHRPDLAQLAVTMFAGTAELARDVQRGELGIHWQGAKHHAMADHSSGFCVFNDMAYVARLLANAGERVFYVDWDAHHGDGVEVLTRTTRGVTTFSVHERGIFPGTGLVDNATRGTYNRPLEPHSGDDELVAAVADAIVEMSLSTTTILVAAGADGADGDPLSTLRYSLDGYDEVGRMIGQAALARGARVILGGAGGYRPRDLTPQVWAHTAHAVARGMELVP